MITDFQIKVYHATQKIPAGKVCTYKTLAQSIGCNSARAIGQALKRNPYAPTIPCHRVIASDLSIGGFEGETEGQKLTKKKRLLIKEGVKFEGKIVSEECVLKSIKKIKY